MAEKIMDQSSDEIKNLAMKLAMEIKRHFVLEEEIKRLTREARIASEERTAVAYEIEHLKKLIAER